MFDPVPNYPALRLGPKPAPLPPGLTEAAVTTAIKAVGARIADAERDPTITERDIIITAWNAFAGAANMERIAASLNAPAGGRDIGHTEV